MREKEAEVIRVAYARLTALKENVPAGAYGQVPELHVSEYHAVLDQLARIGVDIDQFRVPTNGSRNAGGVGGEPGRMSIARLDTLTARSY